MRYSDYTSGFGHSGTPKGVKGLIAVNVALFFLLFAGFNLIPLFGLTPLLVKKGFLWQFVTYLFLHSGFFHIFFNMFALWMFGKELEREWGTGEFIKYYFLTGIGAGLFTFVFSLNSAIPTIGASGAIFGILAAYTLMFPDNLIYVYFLFPIKAKYLVIFFAIIELLASFRYTPDGIGHFAHLGGMVVGYMYLKSDLRILRFTRFFKEIKYKRKLKEIERKRDQTEKLLQRVDQILDRINQVGYDNLSKEEKRILEKASHILSQNSDRQDVSHK